MKAREELARLPPPRPSVATLGVFDGPHLGHQHLFRELRWRAGQLGFRSVAVTFQNNPRMVVRPQDPVVPYLASLKERLRLLGDETDLVVPLTFDFDLSRLRAREFLTLLREALDLRELILGPSFSIGHSREIQTLPALSQIGEEMGFTVSTIQALEVDGSGVSSTRIREALTAGEIELTTRLLGRPFSMTGEVVAGQKRGRRLGFPTANLLTAPFLALPADGVYATWARVGETRWPSATNVGVRPTFGPGDRTVEAHLLDFSDDLYGQQMGLGFVRRLRDERRFESEEDLVAQMHRDVDEARAVLASSGHDLDLPLTHGQPG